MKRENLEDKLYCLGCGFLGKPSEFKHIPKYDIVLCPFCRKDHVVVASSIEWCNECKERPQEEGRDLCAYCQMVADENTRLEEFSRVKYYSNGL